MRTRLAMACLGTLPGLAHGATWVVADEEERGVVASSLESIWPGHDVRIELEDESALEDPVLIRVADGVLELTDHGRLRQLQSDDPQVHARAVQLWLRAPTVAAPPPLPLPSGDGAPPPFDQEPPAHASAPAAGGSRSSGLFGELSGGPGQLVGLIGEGGGSLAQLQLGGGWRGTGWSLGLGGSLTVGEVHELVEDPVVDDAAVRRRRLDLGAWAGLPVDEAHGRAWELRFGPLLQSTRDTWMLAPDMELRTSLGAGFLGGVTVRAVPGPRGLAPLASLEGRVVMAELAADEVPGSTMPAAEGTSVLLRVGLDLGPRG